jgi:paraquat-inducible protein A
MMMSMPAAEPSTEMHLCPQRDLLALPVRLQPGQSSHCPRCGAEADRGTYGSRRAALALALTAAQLWLLMNAFPLVSMSLGGVRRQTTLVGAALALVERGKAPLGALVGLTTVVAPGIEIAVALAVLSSLDRLARAGWLGHLVRWYRALRRWSMVDVFMLGCLVSLVKLAHLADIVVGPGLWACAALLPVLALLGAYARPQALLRWTDELRAA